MGRRPCCAKEGLNRGAWTAWEDEILINFVKVHGEGKWRDLPQIAENMVEGEVEPKNMSSWPEDFPVSCHEAKIDELMDATMTENLRESDHFQPNNALILKKLSSILYSEDELIV